MGSLYGHNLGCYEPSETDTFAQIFQLQHELNEWQQSLPVGLQTISFSEMAGVNYHSSRVERYRFVLTLRYLNTQLLLQRPLLTKMLNNTDAELTGRPYSINQMQEHLNWNCTKTAEEIISIIHSVLTRPELGRRLLGAWWFTVYYSEYCLPYFICSI